ncbi:unnamed protein product, partial [Fusarium langsethiae]
LNQEYQILICRLCQAAIRPGAGIESHFRYVHQLKGQVLKDIKDYYGTLKSAIDELIAASQARLEEEDAIRLRKGDLKEEIDRDSPWVKRLGWVRHFGSRDLINIHDAAQWLRAREVTGRSAGRQEDKEAARERLLLSRLGESFDRKVQRCCWRLDSVPTETLQWLNSISSVTQSDEDEDEDEHRDEDEYRDDDDSDDGEQGDEGLTSPLQDALDRAVFRFIVASIKTHVGGNVYTNSLLCFCAALGIKPRPMGYMEPHLYTGLLAAIVWWARLFFLEAVFKNQPPDRDEVGVKAVLTFKEQHTSWMCMGTHTVMSTIIGWMAYGKGYRQKT